jgi:hypothetical protein
LKKRAVTTKPVPLANSGFEFAHSLQPNGASNFRLPSGQRMVPDNS